MGASLGALVGFCIVAPDSKRQLAKSLLGFVIVADFLLAGFGRGLIIIGPRRWEKLEHLGYQNLVAKNTKRPPRTSMKH
jgi:hypothetical protein